MVVIPRAVEQSSRSELTFYLGCNHAELGSYFSNHRNRSGPSWDVRYRGGSDPDRVDSLRRRTRRGAHILPDGTTRPDVVVATQHGGGSASQNFLRRVCGLNARDPIAGFLQPQ